MKINEIIITDYKKRKKRKDRKSFDVLVVNNTPKPKNNITNLSKLIGSFAVRIDDISEAKDLIKIAQEEYLTVLGDLSCGTKYRQKHLKIDQGDFLTFGVPVGNSKDKYDVDLVSYRNEKELTNKKITIYDSYEDFDRIVKKIYTLSDKKVALMRQYDNKQPTYFQLMMADLGEKNKLTTNKENPKKESSQRTNRGEKQKNKPDLLPISLRGDYLKVGNRLFTGFQSSDRILLNLMEA